MTITVAHVTGNDLWIDEPAPGSFHHGAAAILRANGRVLLVHRSPHRDWAPDSWDTPGGHVEDGETEKDTVVREIREELGVLIDMRLDLPIARLRGPNFDVAYFVIDTWRGDPFNAAPHEHDGIGWFALAELSDLNFADAKLLPIVEEALH